MRIITHVLDSRYNSDGVFIPTHVELTDLNYQTVRIVLNNETNLYTYYSNLIGDDGYIRSKNEFDLATAILHAYHDLGFSEEIIFND